MAELISTLSMLGAAIAFVAGVTAWKREFVGKRRIELAEEVLALFYEAENAIRGMRSPFGHSGEGSTRERRPNETKEESELLDQGFVVVERYKKHEKLFAQLRSMRYRVMATFGPTAAAPFDELAGVLNDIFLSARMLGKHYWQRQGRVSMDEAEFQRHLAGMRQHEAVFWFTEDEEDEISPRVRAAVTKVEAMTSEAAHAQKRLWGSATQMIKEVLSHGRS